MASQSRRVGVGGLGGGASVVGIGVLSPLFRVCNYYLSYYYYILEKK